GAGVVREELVGPEVGGRADVRAAVDVRAEVTVVLHDEAAHSAPGALETEDRAVAGRHQCGGAAPLVRARHDPDGIIHGYARDRRARCREDLSLRMAPATRNPRVARRLAHSGARRG